jgi:DNA polymerase elongation subunit (family B)
MNSMYGVCGFNKSPLYNVNLASAITTLGVSLI